MHNLPSNFAPNDVILQQDANNASDGIKIDINKFNTQNVTVTQPS